ncbi:MAG: PilZ domain-containing protein [Candidatus Omnitrophica bacterium]|nr:PilZ domain-containing protein [Candidatus Omnitrophota bacterium]
MGQETPFQERRRYVRLKTCVEVKYTVIGKPGGIQSLTKNISAGGLCLTTDEKLSTETPLQLELKLPDLKDTIRALGRVVWQKNFESGGKEPKIYFDTGIEFTGISDFDRFNINRYILEHVEPVK